MSTHREKWSIEVTDTFAGEANYSWVRRYDVFLPRDASARSVMQAARKAAGLTGSRGETKWLGDAGEYRPRGMCVVMFVTWREWPEGDAMRTYHRPPTASECRQGYGATHYRDFPLCESCDAEGNRQHVIRASDDGLFYSCK